MGFSAVFRPSFLLGCSWYLIHDRHPYLLHLREQESTLPGEMMFF